MTFISGQDMQNVLWNAADAAAACNGALSGDWSGSQGAFTGISIDSRTIQPGELFVAIRGERVDGHDYVVDALNHGAAAVLVEEVPGDLPPSAPLIRVRDSFQALKDLGQVARGRVDARIIAVTGSVGKTGTKEALRHILSEQGPTYATKGNFNNHYGVPLSLARMPSGSAYGVFELGMNHANEIAPLSKQVRPDIAIITTVEAVHLENFDDVGGIADAKAEIFAGMSADGIAILNRDNPYFSRLVAHARTQGIGRILSFGTHEMANARLLDCSLHGSCSAVNAIIGGTRLHYCISMPGRHHVMNSLAVLLAVKCAGGDVAAASRAFSRLEAVSGRGARQFVKTASGRATLIDESYNASPVAMEAAITTLGMTDPLQGRDGKAGRRIAVLGDMLELGPDGPAMHGQLARALVREGIDLVFTCGPLMAHLADQLPDHMLAVHGVDSGAIAGAVADVVRGGDVVLVKGSAGSRMSLVVDALQARGQDKAGARDRAAS